jgi:hypothetical protein
MPFVVHVFLVCILLFDVVQLLVLDLGLVFGFFVGAGDSGCERSEDVGGVGCEAVVEDVDATSGMMCMRWRRAQ